MGRKNRHEAPATFSWRRRFLYRSYARAYPFGQWYQRKFTPAGQLVLPGALITGLFGMDILRSTAYQAFAFLAFLLAVSMALSFRTTRRLEARRILPDYATAGTPFSYTLCIRNRSGRRISRIEVQEMFKDPRPDIATFFSTPEPFDHTRNAWDRRVKAQRWLWLIQQGKNAGEERFPVPAMAPDEAVEVRARLTPLHRGMIYFNGVYCLMAEPLGISRSWRLYEQHDKLLILPKRYTLPPMAIPGSRKHHNGGLSLTSRIGDSDEFISLRDYRPGDAMRQLHWKSWAKTGKLIIRENQEEHFSRHALILDTHTTAPGGQDVEVAVSLAASFVATVATGESLLDLMFARDAVYRISSGRQLASAGKLLEVLALIRAGHRDTFPELSRRVRHHSKQLSGVTLILTGLDSQRLELIQRLRRSGIATTVFQVCNHEDEVTEHRIHPVLINDVQRSLNRFRGAP